MIMCPNCLHKELVGSLFCTECGAQLFYNDGFSTSSNNKSKILSPESLDEILPDSISHPKNPVSTSPKDMTVALCIVSSGEIIPLASKKDVSLGRVSDGQPAAPDVDLTPYKAYEAGVSRLHTSISIIDNQVMVSDLGSANGTRINGIKVTSHIPYPIRNGDILTLGKMKIQVLIRNIESGG